MKTWAMFVHMDTPAGAFWIYQGQTQEQQRLNTFANDINRDKELTKKMPVKTLGYAIFELPS